MSATRAGKEHSGDRSYWNRMAFDFSDEIFDVCGSDRTGVVLARIRKLASQRKTAIDLGCGIGRTLPQLSKLFGKVYGVDISRRCLALADKLNLRNVELMCADITKPNCRLPQCDVAVCINAILSPGAADCRHSLDLIRRVLKQGGAAVVVVPSLESVLFTRARISEHCFRSKINPRPALDDYCRLTSAPGHQGPLVAIDGVPTRHFLREELVSLLMDREFKSIAVAKVEYDWASEMTDPPWPDWPPYPWDWCATARA